MIARSAIPVTLTFNSPRTAGQSAIVPMKTTVPAESLAFLPSAEGNSSRVDLYISVFDDAGRNIWFVHLVRDANLAKAEARTGTFNELTVGVAQQLVQF